MQQDYTTLAEKIGKKWNFKRSDGKRLIGRLTHDTLIKILEVIDPDMSFDTIDKEYKGMYHYIALRINKQLFHDWMNRATHRSCLSISQDPDHVDAIIWLENPNFAEYQHETERYIDRFKFRKPWYNFRRELCKIADTMLLDTEYSSIKEKVFKRSNNFEDSLYIFLSNILICDLICNINL